MVASVTERPGPPPRPVTLASGMAPSSSTDGTTVVGAEPGDRVPTSWAAGLLRRPPVPKPLTSSAVPWVSFWPCTVGGSTSL